MFDLLIGELRYGPHQLLSRSRELALIDAVAAMIGAAADKR
jgi:hypothetical protein